MIVSRVRPASTAWSHVACDLEGTGAELYVETQSVRVPPHNQYLRHFHGGRLYTLAWLGRDTNEMDACPRWCIVDPTLPHTEDAPTTYSYVEALSDGHAHNIDSICVSQCAGPSSFKFGIRQSTLETGPVRLNLRTQLVSNNQSRTCTFPVPLQQRPGRHYTTPCVTIGAVPFHEYVYMDRRDKAGGTGTWRVAATCPDAVSAQEDHGGICTVYVDRASPGVRAGRWESDGSGNLSIHLEPTPTWTPSNGVFLITAHLSGNATPISYTVVFKVVIVNYVALFCH